MYNRTPLTSGPTQQCMQQYTFQITGLKCEGCAARLKATLAKEVVGVESVQVDFSEKTVSLRFPEESEVSMSQIRDVVGGVDFTYILHEPEQSRICDS
ncbi:hypothetical protein HDU76_004823 [Blyttiomyces sp. JEL0837]|nr:hypothetical protein HDU76_004823 [Blyttiomyces sp. JEL0837]